MNVERHLALNCFNYEITSVIQMWTRILQLFHLSYLYTAFDILIEFRDLRKVLLRWYVLNGMPRHSIPACTHCHGLLPSARRTIRQIYPLSFAQRM